MGNYLEPLLQTLETELGGVVLYATALKAVQHYDLRSEFEWNLDQSGRHLEIVYELFDSLKLNRDEETPGRLVSRHLNESLIDAMDIARLTLRADAAEAVACECAMVAQSRENQSWDLLTQIGRADTSAVAIRRACSQINEHEPGPATGRSRCRELWLASLGVPSLPDTPVGNRVNSNASITTGFPQLNPMAI